MANSSSSPDLRPLKRSASEKDSAFNYLLTAAKKVRSETKASRAETANITEDSGCAKERGEGLRGGLPEQGHNERIHLTKYIGVRWSTKKAKWRVRIKANGKDNHVGFFSDEQSAAQAYDKAVLRFFPSATLDRSIRLNFPLGSDISPAEDYAATRETVSTSRGSCKPRHCDSKDKGLVAALMHNSETSIDQGIFSINYASAFSGSVASSSPRTRNMTLFGNQNSVSQGVGVHGSLPPIHLAPLSDSSSSQRRSAIKLHSLAHPNSRCEEKSSIAHLLDDKSTLERGSVTSSPLDESPITPSNLSVGGYSTISTPATMPSPSLLLSPTAGCSAGSRSHSASFSSRPCPHFSDTPTLFAPPRLCTAAPATKRFAGPAVCFTSDPPSILQSMTLPFSYASHPSAGSEDQHNEMEALKGLVKLGDAQEGPKTRRSRNQASRSEPGWVDSSFREPHSQLERAPTSLSAQAGGTARVMPGSKQECNAGSRAALDPAPARPASASSALESMAHLSESPRDHESDPSPASLRRSKPPSKASLKAAPGHGDGDGAKVGGLMDEAGSRPGQAPPARGPPSGQLLPTKAPQGKGQSFRGVTWDKVKQMWRVRLCLAGGGREHVGYFANEEAGAMAYARALERLKMQEGALPARAMERYNLEREARTAESGTGAAAATPPLASAPPAASAGPPPRV